MTDQPHVTIEFVGGPFCGAVVDSRTHPLRSAVLRQLLSAARSEQSAELRLRQLCSRRVRVAVGKAAPTSTTTRRGSVVTVNDDLFCTPRPKVTTPSKSPASTAVATFGRGKAVRPRVVAPAASC